ncbi:hypothetical protein W04_3343 [Pseudoalteromonas sp. SW0106-04]|nr:hypothetical protein W04_3343 [Pseudoalteromonas sp. SW0106-04]
MQPQGASEVQGPARASLRRARKGATGANRPEKIKKILLGGVICGQQAR